MSHNIVDAIIYLIKNPITCVTESYIGKNRINNVGNALENYIQDLFIGGFGLTESERNILISKHFSYLGNASNPPDMMLRGGDAIEVKKIERSNSELALNSSYPKDKLFIDNPMITSACRSAEDWKSKDILYAIGVLSNGELKKLSFIYGEDYFASKEVYERIKHRIKEGVEIIEGIEFSPTKELGKIKRIDPLGITSLRVRGMWHVENPLKTFNYIHDQSPDELFSFMAIINDEKWHSLVNISELVDIIQQTPNASLTNIKIKNPNNPAQLKSAKLIKFSIGAV